MLAWRVFGLGVIGGVLIGCGDSRTRTISHGVAGAAAGGASSAGRGGTGASDGGASVGGTGASGGSAGRGAMGGAGNGSGAGGKAGATGGAGATGIAGDGAGDGGEAGDGTGGGSLGGTSGTSGASGAGGEGGSGPLGEGLEGIYTLDDVMLSTGSCDSAGSSIRGSYVATHLVVRSTTIAGSSGGTPALVVAGCAGLAACRTLGEALVEDATAYEHPPYSVLPVEDPPGTFTGRATFYGMLDGMTCRNGGVELMSLSVAGAALRHEARVQRTDYPAVNGTCPPAAASQAGAAAPCTQRRVITGTRVETF